METTQTAASDTPVGSAPSRADRLIAWTVAHPRLLLWLALALSLLVRLFLIARSHAMIDGDEAMVGIQAQRILHGQFPTYFYGQAYMGSLETYLVAAVFKVFGPSAWALRSVPLALSLLLVALTWRVAREILPRDARTTPFLTGLCALFAAAPPLYDAVAELRAWGGQIEIYIVSLALLLSTLELARRLREGAGRFELTRRWLILGFLAGLGVWINPLVSYALVACGFWLLAALIEVTAPALWSRITRRPTEFLAKRRASARMPPHAPALQGSEQTQASNAPAIDSRDVSPRAPALQGREESSPPVPDRKRLLPLLALVPGIAVGGLPAWIYALRHAGANLAVYTTQPTVTGAVSGAARHGRIFLGAAITARYASCVAPRVLDGGLPTEPLAFLPLRLTLLLPPLIGIGCALWLLLVRRDAAAPRVGMPILYAAVVTAVFCLGTSAWGATKSCSKDWAGRYAVPLALVEPFLLLALFAAPAVWSAWRRRRGHAPLTPAALRRGWTVALLVLALAGAVQVGTYALDDPAMLFQSPFYTHVGLDQTQLTNYLKAHDIHYAWANHWVGNIVTFETNGATTCADYYDQIALGGLRRPP
ncbi:MAG TPA: hypothetical protein VJN88_12410, partial [Ktedonobacterales bacterium]|nr:hypothetical protein [Ktedonobacterales bacterium]